MSKYNICTLIIQFSVVRFQPNFGFGGGQNPNRMQGIDQRFGGSPGFMPSRQELKKPYGSM